MTKPALVHTPFRGAARAAAYVEDSVVRPKAAAPATPLLEPIGTIAVLDGDVLVEDDLGTLSLTERPDVARTGIRGLVVRTGIKLKPSNGERALLAAADQLRRDEDTIRQATWSRAVGILVANRKGGVGKTPTAVVVGGLLANIRGGSVAIIEVSDDPGTLTFRAEGSPSRGIGELVDDALTIGSAGQLAGYTAPQTSYASVIGTVGPRTQLVANDVLQVADVVDRHYAIRVMDSGNQPSSSAFDGAVAAADTLIIPVLNSADVVLEAVALLEQLRASGNKGRALADNATVLRLIDGRPENPTLVDQLTRLLERQHVAGIYTIPYDPHIAERGPITLSKLTGSSRSAFTAAAAGIVRTLQNRTLDQ